MVKIRPATVQDARAIAEVHVASWRSTYRGIVPDEYLDTLSVERRAEGRARMLADPPPGVISYVAEGPQGVIGFADGGLARDDFADYEGELYAIYLLQAEQGQGTGRQLFGAIGRALLRRRLSGMYLWVLAENPSRGFSTALGGRVIASQSMEIGDTRLEEVAYGWDDLKKLVERATRGGKPGGQADGGH